MEDNNDSDRYPSEVRVNLLKDRVLNVEPEPVPTDYSSLRNSLSVEAREWRVFNKQADALACASKLAHLGVMTFTFHHSNCSRRYFLATHPLELWYQNKDRPSNYNYEIIAEGRPSKLYLDLEFNREDNPNHDGAKMTDTFNKVMLFVLNKEFHLSLNETHILNLDSTTDKKFSRHIIYQFPFPLVFKNNIEAGSIVIKTCNLIRDSLDTETATDITKEINITRSELEMLEVMDSKGNVSLFVDEGVYTKNRHFRLLGSSKFGRNAPLVLSPENKFTVPVATEKLYNEYIFLASLITYSTMIKTLIPTVEIKEKDKIPKIIPTLTSKNVYSTYSGLDRFILRVISPCTIDVILHYENGTILVYVTKEAGFCCNVGRQHQKNRVMYVVHIKRGIYFQKCHDPDCRGFKSKSALLPRNVLDEIGLKADKWDDPIVKLFLSLSVEERQVKHLKSSDDTDSTD